MANGKDKEKVRSRRLTEWDYKMICKWLQEPANKDSIFGSEKKTPIGKLMPSKNKAFVKLAEYINEHRSHKSQSIPIDGKAMGQRFRSYLTKYNDTKKASQSIGFGVDDIDYQHGIKMLDKLLDEMCPWFGLMDSIFGKQPNIGVPIVRMTCQQGDPNVSTGSTSSGESDGLLNIQDEEINNYGVNRGSSQRVGGDKVNFSPKGDVGIVEDNDNPLSLERVDDDDWSPPRTFNVPTDEVPIDLSATAGDDTCILDKSPEVDAGKDKGTSNKKQKDRVSEDESHNAGSKSGKGSKHSFGHQFKQSMEILCASHDKLTDVVIADRRDSSVWQKQQAERDLQFWIAMEERQKIQCEMEMSCRERDLEFRKTLEMSRLEWEKTKHLAELHDRELMRKEWKKDILELYGKTQDEHLLMLLKEEPVVDGSAGVR